MISFCGGKSFRRAVKSLTFSPALISISVLTLIPALALIAAAPVCRAESGSSNSGVSLDKHARKIHHELTHFSPGNYIRLTFTDKSERTVALDSLDDSSFTVTNAESNNRETHTYDEIARVNREKNYIGEGSEGHVRHIRLWVPIAIGVLAAGAAFTAAEVR
ncbi:MAG: hypothetical protein WBE74_16850 [Terracidiphilus sp.]